MEIAETAWTQDCLGHLRTDSLRIVPGCLAVGLYLWFVGLFAAHETFPGVPTQPQWTSYVEVLLGEFPFRYCLLSTSQIAVLGTLGGVISSTVLGIGLTQLR